MSDPAAKAESTSTSASPQRVPAPSEIRRITLFEDRAEVARRARATLPAGVHWVVVEGLALMIDDASVSAGIDGEAARVLAARVHRRTRNLPAASADEIAAIERDIDEARGRRVIAERGLGRAQAEQARLAALLDRWTQALRRVPKGGAEEMRKWRTAHDDVDAALGRALDETSARAAELEAAKLDEQRALLRLSQGRTVHPRYEAAVEIQVQVTPEAADRELVLELQYRTPMALWRPQHTARLLPREGGGWELSIATVATVWQRTGEDWRDVRCRFSTARPAQASSPPLLTDDVLTLQKKADRSVTVEVRDQTIQQAGLDRGTRAVDDMPGVEDGGEPLAFEAAREVTVPSDGQPFRVEIGERRMPCEVDLVVYAERGEAAHLRATATLAGTGPLLAGPVLLARGASMVGRGKTAFVAQGEPFELGFGPDDGVRVRRAVGEERDTTPVIGTQKIKRFVRLYISNLGGEARRLNVVERIPVSEIGDVSIEVVNAGGAKVDDDGFARFSLEVGANQTAERALSYKIEAAAKVRMTF